MKENSFDRLVSDLTDSERFTMLEKMKASGTSEETLAYDEDYDKNIELSFSRQIKNESLFFRIFLWFKSLFANTSVEVIYNEQLLDRIARKIERISPGLVDYKRGLLTSQFYNKLCELKLCADFFRPYISLADEDENNFLVFLGSIVMEDVQEKITQEADPYSVPVDSNPHPEYRVQFLKKMEQIFSDIPVPEKNMMYQAVQGIQWLKHFTRLPFQKFISLFSSVVDGNYSCSFKSLDNELDIFAKVLCNGVKIPQEVFEALFLFTRKSTFGKNLDSSIQAAQKAEDFMEKSKSQISLIKMFITTVPLKMTGKLVYSDARWTPENLTGGEDWFQKFKAAWRKIFDYKWESYIQDCKKENLRHYLSASFNLETFPMLPERPWTTIWGGLPFCFEFSAGFLNWYISKLFPENEIILKTIMLEGDFIQKENRQEFGDAFNKLIQISIDLNNITRLISSGGEYGMIFSKLEKESLHTLQAHSKVESIIYGIESDFRSMINRFCDAARSMELCFTGIFKEKTDANYDGLTNLKRISGKNNELFMKKMTDARTSLKNAFNMIKELESIDKIYRKKI